MVEEEEERSVDRGDGESTVAEDRRPCVQAEQGGAEDLGRRLGVVEEGAGDGLADEDDRDHEYSRTRIPVAHLDEVGNRNGGGGERGGGIETDDKRED